MLSVLSPVHPPCACVAGGTSDFTAVAVGALALMGAGTGAAGRTATGGGRAAATGGLPAAAGGLAAAAAAGAAGVAGRGPGQPRGCGR